MHRLLYFAFSPADWFCISSNNSISCIPMKCNKVITNFTICHTVKRTFSQETVTQPINCPLSAPCAALSGSGEGAQIPKTQDAAG